MLLIRRIYTEANSPSSSDVFSIKWRTTSPNASNMSAQEQEEKIVIIDTDAGLDDTLALLMAIKAHQDPSIPFRIVGITCVHGNTTVDNVTVNVTKILQTVEATEIPIYRGAEMPMVAYNYRKNHRHHGSDGFGDLNPTDFPRLIPKLESENAVSAIIRLANEYEGPLTNLGLAIRVDSKLGDKINKVFIMGGSCEDRGNKSSCADFNFLEDPESVHITFSSYKCPILIAPIELGRRVVIQTLDWRVNVLGQQNTPECILMNRIEKKLLEESESSQLRVWKPYDSTIVAAIIEPMVVEQTINHPCHMELLDYHTRGQLIIDMESQQPSNIHIITHMDQQLFQKMLIWALNSKKIYKI